MPTNQAMPAGARVPLGDDGDGEDDADAVVVGDDSKGGDLSFFSVFQPHNRIVAFNIFS